MATRAALLAEGSSDRGLIGILERLCARRGCEELKIDYGDQLLAMHNKVGRAVAPRVAKLLEIDPEYNLLFIHRDADADDPTPRLSEIEQAFEKLAVPHVRVVPIHELEAWLLVDEGALLRQFGKPPKSMSLEIPPLKQIERRARPKELLKAALARAKVRKRSATPKPISEAEFKLLRARLLEDLDIDGPVTRLSAWQQLLADIDKALASIPAPSAPTPEPPT
jgi:hypothetical protein